MFSKRNRAIDSIDNLNCEIKKCAECRLAKTRRNVLCGEGFLHTELMLVAQAPGENEDREGRMFIGPSGKVLDALLRMVRIDRHRLDDRARCFQGHCFSYLVAVILSGVFTPTETAAAAVAYGCIDRRSCQSSDSR